MVFYYTFNNIYENEDFDGITVDYEFTPSDSLLRKAVESYCSNFNIIIACELSRDELETFIVSHNGCYHFCDDWLYDEAREECQNDLYTLEMYKEALEDEYDRLHPLQAVGMSERDFM